MVQSCETQSLQYRPNLAEVAVSSNMLKPLLHFLLSTSAVSLLPHFSRTCGRAAHLYIKKKIHRCLIQELKTPRGKAPIMGKYTEFFHMIKAWGDTWSVSVCNLNFTTNTIVRYQKINIKKMGEVAYFRLPRVTTKHYCAPFLTMNMTCEIDSNQDEAYNITNNSNQPRRN